MTQTRRAIEAAARAPARRGPGASRPAAASRARTSDEDRDEAVEEDEGGEDEAAAGDSAESDRRGEASREVAAADTTSARPAAEEVERPARTPSSPSKSASASTAEVARETRPPEPSPRAAPARPKGPILVPASRTKLESGSIRPLRFPPGEQPPAQIVAKLCTDPRGSVTSVTVLSQVSPGVRNAVQRALSQWRYKPIVEGNEKVSACFATAFPVRVE